MAYKILTKNGIDNSNIDGARAEHFNSGMRNGIVQGALNEGKFTTNASNSIYLDSCELRIAGHRIVIDSPVYKTFSTKPSKATRYSFVAQIVVNQDRDVEFSLIIQSPETVLIQDNLYATTTGNGTYQVEIGRFTLTPDGTIEDVTKTIDTITGGGNDVGKINIGTVETEKINYKLDAEVDVTERYDAGKKKTFTDLKFVLPIDFPVDFDEIDKQVKAATEKSDEALTAAKNFDTSNFATKEQFNSVKSDVEYALAVAEAKADQEELDELVMSVIPQKVDKEIFDEVANIVEKLEPLKFLTATEYEIESTYGYIKLKVQNTLTSSDTLLLQWGQVPNNENPTVTLKKAYANTYYNVFTNARYTSKTPDGYGYITSQTTTNFKMIMGSGVTSSMYFAIGMA